MNVFGDPYNRGCFVRKSVDTSGGRGAKLIGTTSIPSSPTDPFVIQSFSVQKAETVALMRCFNDKSFIYAFGDNIEQSLLGVKIIAFMPAESANASIDSMLDFYQTNRIYKQDKPVMLTYGGSHALKGHILGMNSSTVSAEFGMHSFDLKLLLVK